MTITREQTRAAQDIVDSLRVGEFQIPVRGVSITRVRGYLFNVTTPSKTYRLLGADEAIETIRPWLPAGREENPPASRRVNWLSLNPFDSAFANPFGGRRAS